jgi:hypothetical protein
MRCDLTQSHNHTAYNLLLKARVYPVLSNGHLRARQLSSSQSFLKAPWPAVDTSGAIEFLNEVQAFVD